MSPGGYIYAIGASGTSLVKIGYAKSVEKRLRALQVGHPFPLQVLATIPVANDVQWVERQIHVLLAQQHRRGEWFDVAMDEATLAALVERVLTSLGAEQVVQRRAVCRGSIMEEDMRRLPLWERIFLLRRRRKMTQGALAQAVGVAKNTISRLEQGRIDDVQGHTIAQLARTLDVTTDYLLGMAEDEDAELRAAVAV